MSLKKEGKAKFNLGVQIDIPQESIAISFRFVYLLCLTTSFPKQSKHRELHSYCF